MSNAGKTIEITSGSLLAKNTLWNTLGLVLPLVIGLFAIPFLIHGLGTERFGVLTIAWMVIGYFSIFDFGLGRALTKLIAECLGKKDYESIPSLFWTAMTMMLCIGLVGSIVVGVLTKHIVFHWLNIAPELQPESLIAFYILTISIPVVIATTGFRGVLEAYQKFAIISMIRIPLGLLTFLGPLAVLPFSTSLASIVAVLLLGRLLAVVVYYYCCINTVPEIRKKIVIDKQHIRPLLKFGGWMTLCNLIGPLMVYLDRFLIGSLLTMTAVSYYVAPYEMVTKLWMIPMGLIGVLFPAFSTMLASNREQALKYYSRGVNLIFFAMLPIFLVINSFAFEGLNYWLGNEFSENSTKVVQWLAIGVFVNCVGRVPYVLIQGAGRPDLPAKLYIIELPLYLIGLWFALKSYGIEGAAFIWTIRVVVDTFAFLFLVQVIIPSIKRSSIILASKLIVGILILFFTMYIDELLLLLLSYVDMDLVIKFLITIMEVLIMLLVGWVWGIKKEDREKIINLLRIKSQ